MPLGVNLGFLTKILKCAKDDDVFTLGATDDADMFSLAHGAESSDRIAEYGMKLVDIDADQLGIPDTIHDARVTTASQDFPRTRCNLFQLGESVRIKAPKKASALTPTARPPTVRCCSIKARRRDESMRTMARRR